MTKNWEGEKERMHEMYMVRGFKLAHLQKIMAENYGFQASERAYKQKFKEWRWFKKTPRSSGHPSEGGYGSDIDAYSEPEASSRHDSYMVAHSRSRGIPTTTYDPHYDQFQGSLGYEPPYTTAPDSLDYGAVPPQMQGMTMGPVDDHIHAHSRTSGMIGGPPVSLPPVAQLQQSNFKEHLRQAEINFDMGNYDQAEKSLDNAMRTLQWLRNYS